MRNDGTRRLILHLEEPVMKDLRKMAQKKHRTMQGLVYDAIEDFLRSCREGEDTGRQAKPNRPVLRLAARNNEGRCYTRRSCRLMSPSRPYSDGADERLPELRRITTWETSSSSVKRNL